MDTIELAGLFTFSEAAPKLGLTLSGVVKAVMRGKLKTTKIKHLRLIADTEIARYRQETTRGRPPGAKNKPKSSPTQKKQK